METLQSKPAASSQKYEFDVQLNWLEAQTGVLSATDAKGVVRVAAPKVFGGTGNEWSPEHLLLGAVSSCFMSTYLNFAKKFRFEISRLQCHAEGVVESVDGKLKFTTVTIHPTIYVANYEAMLKARLALEKTEQHCLVSNSLNAAIECRGHVIEENRNGL